MAAQEATEEQFNAKVEEVVGNLGVAIVTVAWRESTEDVRAAWKTLGRSFAELVAMEPPR